jgi:cyclohexa-1,5-dienecarbonyl-CoA hydratase
MTKVAVRFAHDGQLAWVALNAPKANILDREMIRELTGTFRQLAGLQELKLIALHGAGAHFSFGASVAEHQPEPCRQMIPEFGELFRALLDARVPTAAVVRGQCLGGGMELAGICTWIFADATAVFGQPEIQLGVFPPVAALIYPWRIGQALSDDLCLTGRTLDVQDALMAGFVSEVAEDPEAAVDVFFARHLQPKSAAALRLTQRASRFEFERAFRAGWAAMERLYLGELMDTADAKEGIAAFLERRPPHWVNA